MTLHEVEPTTTQDIGKQESKFQNELVSFSCWCIHVSIVGRHSEKWVWMRGIRTHLFYAKAHKIGGQILQSDTEKSTFHLSISVVTLLTLASCLKLSATSITQPKSRHKHCRSLGERLFIINYEYKIDDHSSSEWETTTCVATFQYFPRGSLLCKCNPCCRW